MGAAPVAAVRPQRQYLERARHRLAQRSGAVVAIVAEVEIDRHTGKVWARKFTVAHDCGLIINLDGLRRCIEGNVMQGTRRALAEEVAFDRARVTSVDWLSTSPKRPRRSTRGQLQTRRLR
jgi:nicotinate dehydrogenase subunit B